MTAQAVLALPRTPQAPGIARTWLAESFAPQLDARERDTAKLLVSELVTNAVVHGRGRIELHAELDEDRLLIDVTDEGPGFTRTDLHDIGGHGLWIVDAQASRWGIREGTADVWFELQRYQTDGNASSARSPIASPAQSSVPSARSSRSPDLSGSNSHGRRGRAEFAALYRRVTDTLDRSADLAEQHAERERRHGHHQLERVELDRAKRARGAARDGRALSSRLT
jgi:hypothetical protein